MIEGTTGGAHVPLEMRPKAPSPWDSRRNDGDVASLDPVLREGRKDEMRTVGTQNGTAEAPSGYEEVCGAP